MPYRTISTNERCIICSQIAARTCRNCSTSHCDVHLIGASCAGCAEQLWTRERREMKKVIVGLSRLLPVALLAAVAGAGVVAAVAGFLVTAAIVTRAAPIVIRHRLANMTFTPTSRPMLPAFASDEVTTSEPRESEYDVRRRRNKGKSRRWGMRSVFMTRGGHFYQ